MEINKISNLILWIKTVFIDEKVIFMPFSIIFTFLFGFLIYKLVNIKKDDNTYFSILMLYFLGIFLIVIMMYVAKIFNTNNIILLSFITTIILLALNLIINKMFFLKIKFEFGDSFNLFLINTMLIFFIMFFCHIINVPMKQFQFAGDEIWHISNINILSHNSIADFRSYGDPFQYHYFYELILAYYKLLLNIDAFYVYYWHSLFCFPFVYSLTIFAILKKFKTDIKILDVVISNICLFCSNLVEWTPMLLVLNTLSAHLIEAINGAVLGICLLAILFILIKRYLSENDNVINNIIIACFIGLLSGFKGVYSIHLVFHCF